MQIMTGTDPAPWLDQGVTLSYYNGMIFRGPKIKKRVLLLPLRNMHTLRNPSAVVGVHQTFQACLMQMRASKQAPAVL